MVRPCDDSVARVVGGRTAVLRRARGYAPLPVPLRRSSPRVLAVGGHLKNTVCLGVGRQAVLSQHLGDLDSPEARGAFERAIADLQRLYGFQPEVVACDLHPDYFSTQWAESTGLPLVRVQHHEAHALSCLLENDAEEPALAVSWDGTGYGHDGTIWGSEFYLVGPDSLRRVAHLKPFPLAGGDAGAKDCGRSAAGLLHRMGEPLEGPLGQVLSRGTGCVETTSMGRLFDAVAWLLGIAWRNRFEGEAGLALEAAAASSLAGGEYPMGREGDWGPLVDAIRSDMSAGAGVAEIAARFHRSLAAWVESVALEHGVRQVALSGGCFQNAVLTEMVSQRLERHGIRVLTHQLVPMNDGGLALGQLAAAMRVAG
jgi:hydrogenase maturation protein HypF